MTEELFISGGKLWVQVIIITFLYAVVTVRVLTASNNDIKLVETWTVHFARIKLSFGFEGINEPLVLANFVTCLPPEIPRDIAFIPWIIKHVQRWRESWKRSISEITVWPKKRDARAKWLFCQFIPIAFLPFSLPSPSSLLKLPKFWSSTPLYFATCIGVRVSLVQHCKCRRASWSTV